MANATNAPVAPYRDEVTPISKSPAWQAYRILHWGFTAAPVIAGLDKFTHLLVDWDKYVASPVAHLLPFSAHTFMMIVGVVEVVAGLLVAVKPKIGAHVVAAWLAGIVVNLLLAGGFLDIALRDFGLALAALALGRLSLDFDAPGVRARTARGH
jgi:hypothetical protein